MSGLIRIVGKMSTQMRLSVDVDLHRDYVCTRRYVLVFVGFVLIAGRRSCGFVCSTLQSLRGAF